MQMPYRPSGLGAPISVRAQSPHYADGFVSRQKSSKTTRYAGAHLVNAATTAALCVDPVHHVAATVVVLRAPARREAPRTRALP